MLARDSLTLKSGNYLFRNAAMIETTRSHFVRRFFVKRMLNLWFVPVEFAPAMPPGEKMFWWRAGKYYGRFRVSQ